MSKVADRCNGGIKYFGFINQKEFGFDILGLLYVQYKKKNYMARLELTRDLLSRGVAPLQTFIKS